MKKVLFLVFITLIFASCETTDKLAVAPLYSQKESLIEDISGNLNMSQFLLWKQTGFFTERFITIEKCNDKNQNKVFTISVYYTGSSWEFLESIAIRTDDKVIKLSPTTSPYREIEQGGVEERLTIELPKNVLLSILQCKSLTLQYYCRYSTSPIDIPTDGLQRLKEFISL